MISTNTLTSPRLRDLVKQLDAGNSLALEQFWQNIALHSAPLIELLEGDDGHMLVTFLWRAQEETRNVVVISFLTGALNSWRYHKNQLSHLPGTDLWYRSYRGPSDTRTTYQLSPNDALIESEDIEDWGARTATFQNDPLNAHHFTLSADEESGDEEELQSVLELPAAPPQLWVALRPDVPHGKLEMHRMRSEILDNDRRVWVYTPPGYTSDNGPYATIVLFDGFNYHHEMPTPTILDNLLAEGRIPPMIAVLVDSLSYEDRERELSCYPPFVTFLTEELLPWTRQRYAITADPHKTIVGGASMGGLSALFAAWQRPDVFGNVLSQSGSVFWTPPGDADFEWLTRQFVTTERLPLRLYLEVGSLENNPRVSVCPDGPTQLAATRHLRNVLQARGYSVHYAEHTGGHDYVCWSGTLANGILALAGKADNATT